MQNKYVAISAKVARGRENETDVAALQLSLSHTLQCLIFLLGSVLGSLEEFSKERHVWLMSAGLASKHVRTTAPVSVKLMNRVN